MNFLEAMVIIIVAIIAMFIILGVTASIIGYKERKRKPQVPPLLEFLMRAQDAQRKRQAEETKPMKVAHPTIDGAFTVTDKVQDPKSAGEYPND